MPNPQVTVVCESFSTLVALVSSVDAVAVMPERFFEDYAARSGLVRLRMTDPLPRVTVHVSWRADAPLTAPAWHLLDALGQEASEARRDKQGSRVA